MTRHAARCQRGSFTLWTILSLLFLLPACSTTLKASDAALLRTPTATKVFFYHTPRFVVTDRLKSSGCLGSSTSSLRPEVLAFEILVGGLLCSPGTRGQMGQSEHPTTAQQIGGYFVARLRTALPQMTILESPIILSSGRPEDTVAIPDANMTLEFKVEGLGLSIRPAYKIGFEGPTHFESYEARMMTTATLYSLDHDRTVWKESCRVHTWKDLPDTSIRSLLEPNSPSRQIIIEDLIEQCANVLWTVFETELQATDRSIAR